MPHLRYPRAFLQELQAFQGKSSNSNSTSSSEPPTEQARYARELDLSDSRDANLDTEEMSLVCKCSHDVIDLLLDTGTISNQRGRETGVGKLEKGRNLGYPTDEGKLTSTQIQDLGFPTHGSSLDRVTR